MAEIRPYRPDDLDALYDICLKTGDSGQDATALYRDPKLVGHLYAAPYGVLEPQSCLVVEDDEGVGGYIVGALDTAAFAERCEANWWPKLRPDYPEPAAPPRADWTLDHVRAWQIHHPFFAPRRVMGPYPSHLHINLLPRLQGRDFGRRLIDLWLATMRERGSPGAHLGVSGQNHRGLRFYAIYGWTKLDTPEGHWFGFDLRRPPPSLA